MLSDTGEPDVETLIHHLGCIDEINDEIFEQTNIYTDKVFYGKCRLISSLRKRMKLKQKFWKKIENFIRPRKINFWKKRELEI